MVDARQTEAISKAAAATLPAEMTSAVNLFAHPFAGFAAASAIGIGFASQVFGFWLGAMSGVAEASQRMIDGTDGDRASRPARRSAATKAKTAAKVLIEETQSAALEIAGELSTKAEAPSVAAKASVDLQPEDFRQPKSMTKPRKADDLKAISGIGPKLEKVLNGLGVWSYAQIAAWSAEEIAWVEDYLSFKGRIGRDDWIAQAAALASKKR